MRQARLYECALKRPVTPWRPNGSFASTSGRFLGYHVIKFLATREQSEMPRGRHGTTWRDAHFKGCIAIPVQSFVLIRTQNIHWLFAGDHVGGFSVHEGHAVLDGPRGDQADGARATSGHLERWVHSDRDGDREAALEPVLVRGKDLLSLSLFLILVYCRTRSIELRAAIVQLLGFSKVIGTAS